MSPGEVNKKFEALQQGIAQEFDSETPDLKVFLFLIGVQELGRVHKNLANAKKKS